jgi:hypothetical protein
MMNYKHLLLYRLGADMKSAGNYGSTSYLRDPKMPAFRIYPYEEPPLNKTI